MPTTNPNSDPAFSKRGQPTRSQSSHRLNYFPGEDREQGRRLRSPGMSAYVAQRIGHRALAFV